jgi:Glycosyl transferases group 1
LSAVDILVVGLDSTIGWRSAADDLTEAFSRAGAAVVRVGPGPPRRVRTYVLTDYLQARAARRAGERALAEHDPTAVVYCSTTAALLWPRPGAIWLDALAAETRPGRHGVWQRPLERRRLAQAPLVLTMSPRSLAPLRDARPEAVLLPSPVQASGPPAPARDIAALTYAGNPLKRGLERVLAAWSRARRPGETLLVAGVESIPVIEGVQSVGRVSREQFRALLRRTRVFVAAPVREDYGIAPLEALADGCVLVTTPAPGPYPARDLARELDPRLVNERLERPLRIALDDPAPDYAQRAVALLGPYSRDAMRETIVHRVLPRLLGRA